MGGRRMGFLKLKNSAFFSTQPEFLEESI